MSSWHQEILEKLKISGNIWYNFAWEIWRRVCFKENSGLLVQVLSWLGLVDWPGSFHRLRRKIRKISMGETGNSKLCSKSRFWAACSFTNTIGRPKGCQRASGNPIERVCWLKPSSWGGCPHLSLTKQMSRWICPIAEATRCQDLRKAEFRRCWLPRLLG